MANIQINNLQATESELIEFFQLEFEGIVGGGWFKDTFSISTPRAPVQKSQKSGFFVETPHSASIRIRDIKLDHRNRVFCPHFDYCTGALVG
ncbi:hypothetical protein WA1_48990 [Scytonema hofmannii PCC 7110]|uniref:Uncharacterized protein n=1 Tax=Scytonema hofmannii PCC 7110 TaxID=128403 RepID=A0A139WU77_9CYAN|nr:hypothetical protein [Scytonema hofmannii]KYC35957.1 hypothetical protein WA1_48990 [Scytonema hofmannii PCC 7110]